MDVEMRDIGDVKPYEGNPRQNADAVDAVAASIREFGFRQPLVVDEDGVIVVGHTRYQAAMKLGLTQVPVHVAKGLSPEQVRAYRLADNATRDLSCRIRPRPHRVLRGRACRDHGDRRAEGGFDRPG